MNLDLCDPLPAWKTAFRKLIAFRTVAKRRAERALAPGEILTRIATTQREAARTGALPDKTIALWTMERLGYAFGRAAGPGDTLGDPRLPDEARPVAHVGMGVSAVEAAAFDPARIAARIARLAHADHRLFGHESAGAMLGIYERTLPRAWIGLAPLRRPDPADFIASFPLDVRRLISHGYGRLLYFNSMDLRSALRSVTRRTFLDPDAAAQGLAFAHAMVNSADIDRVLETGVDLPDPALQPAFTAGLVYALSFWAWTFPGTLRSLRPAGARGRAIVTAAEEEIEAAKWRGHLRAFIVAQGGGSPVIST